MRPAVMGRALVAAQFVLLTVVALAPGDAWSLPEWGRLAGWGLIGVAVVVGVWAGRSLGPGLTAMPLPNGRVGLVTTGPYRWVRHPIYVAVIAAACGYAAVSGSWWSLGAALALVVLLNFKARFEERYLAAAFPGYAAYRATTGRFLPFGRRQKADGR